METQSTFFKILKRSWQKWSIAVKILPIIIFTGLLKYIFHIYGLEVMQLNILFTSIVAGTIFLIGFLISGVLSDYKESEKIPSELSAIIKTLFDDGYCLYKLKNSETAYQFMEFQRNFVGFFMDWLYKKETTQSMLTKISSMNEFFINFDKEGIQANYIIKMKNEQSNLRKIVLRIYTIRETDFISSGYAIVELMAYILGIGMLILEPKPNFYVSLFFTIIVIFLIFYMLFLIRDIDDPFDYSLKGESGTEISLKPIHDLEQELNNLMLAHD